MLGQSCSCCYRQQQLVMRKQAMGNESAPARKCATAACCACLLGCAGGQELGIKGRPSCFRMLMGASLVLLLLRAPLQVCTRLGVCN